MIRASIARYAAGWTVLIVHCPNCGWHAELRWPTPWPKHRCPNQLELKEAQ